MSDTQQSSSLTLLVISVLLLTLTNCHVQLVDPLPRGQLRGTNRAPSVKPVDRLAPVDYKPFFPAGDKRNRLGTGKRSQMAAVKSWALFEPSKRSFPWRAGVCGDLKNQKPSQDHKRGGQFYYGAKISKTFTAGSVISLKASSNQNHNGYIVFHLCNVDKCGGEISDKCFHMGFCKRLERAYTNLCDKKKTRLCGPIDRRNRDRWYVPCKVNRGVNNYGFNHEMRYKLPNGFTCEHCVLHFYHTSANGCLPAGTREYFTGPDKPSWGQCKGEGGAKGQFAARQGLCGGRKFSEEYYNCADVRVISPSRKKMNPVGKIDFGQIRNGKFHAIKTLSYKVSEFSISLVKKYTIRVEMKWPVGGVSYTIKVGAAAPFTRGAVPVAPFYVFGVANNLSPTAWKSPPMFKPVTVTVVVDGIKTVVRLYLM